ADPQGVDIRADLYSLGCTLYFLLTGRAPFGTAAHPTPTAKLLAHATVTPQPVTELTAGVPPGLAAVLDRLLAKRPRDRFACPDELAEALARFTGGANLVRLTGQAGNTAAPSPSRPPALSTPTVPERSALRRRPWALALLGAVALALGLAALIPVLIPRP